MTAPASSRRLSIATGESFDFDYDVRSLLQEVTRPNGDTDIWTHDNAGNIVVAVTSQRGTSIVSETAYGYDKANRRTAITTPAGTTEFAYDRNSQIVSANYPTSSGFIDQSFAYDATGN